MADKDLIIKLAKLANNNPNDNEANSAARKVCKLLAEDNFAALKGAPTIPNLGGGFSWGGANDPLWDIIKDLKREAYRSPGYTDRTTEAYRQRERQKEAEYRAEQEKQEREAKEQYERKRAQTDAGFRAKEQQEKYHRAGYQDIKIPRVCIKCGKTEETGFIGDEFVCKKCHWQNW